MESAKHEGVSGLDAKATEAHMADPPPLSNRKRVQQMYPNIQRRVQRKHAEHQEMWNQMTEEEKEEHKEKHRRAREESEKRLQKALVEGVNVCVDLHFDDEHSEKERKSMWKQLSLTYCALKKASNPVHLHVTSIVPDSQTENGLKSQGLDSWLVSKHHRSPVDIFTRENVVVLSPDSQNVLKEVSKDKVYVIGGIVDRSVRKGRTKDFAVEESVECARLPVQEYIPNRQSHILNIDQMVSILCTYLETQDWLLTLQQHVPIRRVMSKAERKQLKLPRKDDIDDITEDDTVTTSGDTREIQVDCKTESPSKDASDNEAGSSSSRYMLEKT
jgi:tRNA (guanine9-N1)-methyltransferase